MSSISVWTLRVVCAAHSRASLTEAVNAALVRDGSAPTGHADLAAMVVAWLMDEKSTDDPPPLTEPQIAEICRSLQERIH